jgi:hypothetical protein
MRVSCGPANDAVALVECLYDPAISSIKADVAWPPQDIPSPYVVEGNLGKLGGNGVCRSG